MLAVIPEQAKLINIVGLGFNLNSNDIKTITFKQFLFGCWRDKWRIWHARRNIDMLVGIILKHIFRYKLILVFTTAGARKRSRVQKFYCSKMQAIIPVSKIAASRFDEQFEIVPHGVDIQKFHPSIPQQTNFKIGFFGRVKKTKGIGEFVDAMIEVLPENPKWIANIYGETTSKNNDLELSLKEKIKASKLEERIIFNGFVNFKEAPGCYRNLDIVVCPSYTEGFGLPALEAMASKCAVIATKAGAWSEIITNGKNGYLVDPQSSEQIAEKLDILMSDDSLREKIAQNGYDLVTSKYKIQNEAEGIQKIYDKLLTSCHTAT
ncbi:glycosyltransferase family 4 protein [Allofrancisella guangzhouensis]|nr:glycosyltransferase family 4 protein [Allofrancisella guangzhouensis]MBK2044654.1 glycosyltransferase family 4 protein [Allofrancisella guangzhouensis]MBK2045063.1 glycosyltransferase family 4 protein [Allofrancisella guangzhouensis]